MRENIETTIEPASIARRAYLLYLARGGEHGHDVEDWLRAESELRDSSPKPGRQETVEHQVPKRAARPRKSSGKR